MPAGSENRVPTNSWYVSEKLDGVDPFYYYLEAPRGFSNIQLSTLRVSRRHGDTDSDVQYREKLFVVVGSITVAGAHIEAAMKRLLLVLRGGDMMFELADYQWMELETHLRRECDDSDDRRVALRELLQWANNLGLRDRRNTAVHGAWWLFEGCNGRLSRWPRKAGSRIIVSAGLRPYETLASQCWQFFERLDELVGQDWPRAVLDDPPPHMVPPEGNIGNR